MNPSLIRTAGAGDRVSQRHRPVMLKRDSNLSRDEAVEVGSTIGALIGLGIEGEEGAEAGVQGRSSLSYSDCMTMRRYAGSTRSWCADRRRTHRTGRDHAALSSSHPRVAPGVTAGRRGWLSKRLARTEADAMQVHANWVMTKNAASSLIPTPRA